MEGALQEVEGGSLSPASFARALRMSESGLAELLVWIPIRCSATKGARWSRSG